MRWTFGGMFAEERGRGFVCVGVGCGGEVGWVGELGDVIFWARMAWEVRWES